MRLFSAMALALIACGGSSDGSSDGGGSSGNGGSSAGGAGAGRGGSPGSGGVVEPGDCGPTLSFRMLGGGPAAGSAFCVGRPGGCEGGWFSILDASGNGVATTLACGFTSCSSCESTGCTDVCFVSTPLAAEGIETTWSGIQFVDGTCGDDVACLGPTCVPAGEYVARFCGYALDSGAAGAPADPFSACENAAMDQTCVDVPFTYPSTDPVSGVLDPTR